MSAKMNSENELKQQVKREKERYASLKLKHEALEQQLNKRRLDEGLLVNAENIQLKQEVKRLRDQLIQNDAVLDKYIKAAGNSFSDQVNSKQALTLDSISRISDNEQLTSDQKFEILKQEVYPHIFRQDQFNL